MNLKAGDKVEVINNGGTFSEYYTFFGEYNVKLSDKQSFVFDDLPAKGKTYDVVKVVISAKRFTDYDYILIEDIDTKQVYIMAGSEKYLKPIITQISPDEFYSNIIKEK